MSGEKLPTVKIDEGLEENILGAAHGYSYMKVTTWAGQTPHVREMALLTNECWWVEYQRINVSVAGAPPRVCNIIRFLDIRPRHVPTVGPSVAEVLRRLNDFAEANEAQRVKEDNEWLIIGDGTPTYMRYLVEPAALEPYRASKSEHMREWSDHAHAKLSVPNGPLWDRLEPMFDAAVAGLDMEDARCPLKGWLKNHHPWLGYGHWKEMYRAVRTAKEEAWVERLRRLDFTASYAAQLREAYDWEEIARVMGSTVMINDDDQGERDPEWEPWITEFTAGVLSALTPDEFPHLLTYRGRGGGQLRSRVITSLEVVGTKPKSRTRKKLP